MKTIKLARLVIKHSTSFGAGVASTAVIRSNMAMHSNPIIKGCQYMGIFGISGVVGEAASNYALKQFDELVENFG